MQSQVRTSCPVRGVPRIPMDTEFTIQSGDHYWRVANIVRQREKPCNRPAKSHHRYKFDAVTASLRIILRAYKKQRGQALSGFELHERLNMSFDTTFNSVETSMVFVDVARILRRELRHAEIRFSKTRGYRNPPTPHPLPKETAC